MLSSELRTILTLVYFLTCFGEKFLGLGEGADSFCRLGANLIGLFVGQKDALKRIRNFTFVRTVIISPIPKKFRLLISGDRYEVLLRGILLLNNQ